MVQPFFELPPYTECPNCRKTTFGVIDISRRVVSRRCYACKHIEKLNLPRLDKKVLYLDQNLFSVLYKFENQMKPPLGHEGFVEEVYTRLKRLVLSHQIIMPSSDIHLDESIVYKDSGGLRLAIELLGGDARFQSTDYISLLQTGCAAKAYLEGMKPVFNFDVDEIIDGDRNSWLPRLHITVKSDYSSFADEVRENRSQSHGAIRGIFEQWAQDKISFEMALESELGASLTAKCSALRKYFQDFERAISNEDFPLPVGNSIFSEYRYLRKLVVQLGHAEDEAEQLVLGFWSSEQQRLVPSHRLSAYLFAALARRASNGMKASKVTRGILNDFRAISTFAPYVDAMFVDKECANLLNEGPLNTELSYKARIFSFGDPSAFIEYLKEIEDNADPLVTQVCRLHYG